MYEIFAYKSDLTYIPFLYLLCFIIWQAFGLHYYLCYFACILVIITLLCWISVHAAKHEHIKFLHTSQLWLVYLLCIYLLLFLGRLMACIINFEIFHFLIYICKMTFTCNLFYTSSFYLLLCSVAPSSYLKRLLASYLFYIISCKFIYTTIFYHFPIL